MVINQIVKYNHAADPLSLVFAALADPTRRSILARLSERNVTVNELAEPYDMCVPAISKHLKILEQAGLVSTTKQAQFRPKHLEVERLQEATQWLENYQKLWEQNLTQMDTYLQQMQSKNQEKEA